MKDAEEHLYHKMKWNEPNKTDEEDHRIVQEIIEKDDGKPEQELTHTESEDDRPLEEVGLPTAKWNQELPRNEKMKAATPVGELNAKQIMTVQGWTQPNWRLYFNQI